MRKRFVSAWFLATLLCALTWGVPSASAAPLAPALGPLDELGRVRSVWLHAPEGARHGDTLQVLVALHGMGGNGPDFARDLVADADRNGWLLVAPTIEYGDWRDPSQVAREEPNLTAWLASYLDALPSQTGFALRPRVLLFGHSRGAQLAHRTALFYPERVLAVAAVSAGTYTVPLTQTAQGKALPFPFGIGDFQKVTGHAWNRAALRGVQFWIAVGADDTNPADLPRQWDPYLGTTRVQRARSFSEALTGAGDRALLTLYPNAKHGLTSEMRAGACTFLRAISITYAVPVIPLPTAHHPTAF